MLERSCETGVRRRIPLLRRSVVPVLAVLAAALGSPPVAAATVVLFSEPLAIAEAITPFSNATEQYAFDVTADDDVPGLAAKLAEMVTVDAAHTAVAQARASSDGPQGFSASATVLSASWSTSRAPHAKAMSAVAFTAEAPAPQGRVKAILEFKVALTAGQPHPDGDVSSARFWIEAGEWALPGELDRTAGVTKLVDFPEILLPAVIGAAGYHQQRESGPSSVVSIYANGHTIERIPGSVPVKLTKRIVMNVPPGVLQIVHMGVGAQGNASAYLDPVILPHPDNPDVKITLHAQHDPTSPAPLFPSVEQMAAVGIEVGPLQELGVLDEPAPACGGGGTISPARLAVAQTGVSDVKLRFRGELALAAPFDPLASGARVRVEDAGGEVIIDDPVPGGAYDPATSTGWRHQPERDRWIYSDRARPGVRRLVLTRVDPAQDVYRFVVTASLPSTTVPTAERLPLTATFGAGAPAASDGRCGAVTFGDGEPPVTGCTPHDGTRLVCRRSGAG